MKVSVTDNSKLRIKVAVFFIFYFIYFFVFNRYLVIHQEQTQLFRFDWNYFKDFLSRPGGLADYIGTFLTQFYIFPLAGALILTIAGFAIYLISSYILSRYKIKRTLLALIPILFLAGLHSHHLYQLSYTVGLIISLCYFAFYISIRNSKLYYFFVFVGYPLLYFFTGGYSLVAILLCIIHELLFSERYLRFLVTSIFPILAFGVPYLASLFIYFIKAGTEWTYFLPLSIERPAKYLLIILLVYYPLVLILLKFLMKYSKKSLLSMRYNFKSIMAETLVILCLSFLIIKHSFDWKTELLLGMDYCVQRSDWEGTLKLSSYIPDNNRLAMYFTNLALYKTGRMGDQLFHYRQAMTSGLWLGWNTDRNTLFFGSEIYYHLAYINEAYRWAFEGMVARGPNPRSLKRLAITSIINRDLAIAEKYLNVLDQSLFYRNWAKLYLSYIDNPRLLDADEEIKEKRHFEIHKDFISSMNINDIRLPQLLENHPDNRMAFEYFMSSMLLEKNLGGFASNIYRIKELEYKFIPVHYEEAILVYMHYSKKNIIPEGYSISKTTLTNFFEYVNMVTSFGNNRKLAADKMYRKYGKTFWYYLEFSNLRK